MSKTLDVITISRASVDLYGEQETRIAAALEFVAQYVPPNNAKPPENLEFQLHPTWEIAFNRVPPLVP